MRTVTKQIDFCAGHRLLQYEGKCKYIHGHNFIAEFGFFCDKLNKTGFIIDFSIIKEHMKSWIDKHWDHGFLVNAYDADMLNVLEEHQQKHYVLYEGVMSESYAILGKALPPNNSVVSRKAFCNPTMENLVIILAAMAKSFSEKIEDRQVGLDHIKLFESETGWAEWKNDKVTLS